MTKGKLLLGAVVGYVLYKKYVKSEDTNKPSLDTVKECPMKKLDVEEIIEDSINLVKKILK